MASLSRGFAGLAYHGFATGLLKTHTQHAATVSGSLTGMGGSHILSTLRLRLSPSPSTASATRFFSSSRPAFGKGPKAKKSQTQSKYTPPKPQPAAPTPKPAPKVQAKPRAAPVTEAVARSSGAVPGSGSGSGSGSIITAAAVAGNGFAEQLGRRSISTVLYEAPSLTMFRFTSVMAGVATIIYTFINYWSIFVYPPEDMLWWIPHGFAVICGIMIAAGAYFLSGSFGIIRVIKAIPSAHIEAIAGKGAAATAARAVKDAGGGPVPPVFLELEIGRVLPILPARKRYILPQNMEVPFRFASYGLSGEGVPKSAAAAATGAAAGGAGATESATAPLTSYERVKAHEAEKARQAKSREYEMNHLMTAPFRHAGLGARTSWQQVRRVFSREGFIKVRVNGDRQKMDVTGGWALENGRALDRLVNIKNDL